MLGEIINKEIKLTDIGKIAQKCWMEIPDHFDNATLDEFIVMPNHIHGIIIINNKLNTVGADPCVCPDIDNNKKEGEHTGSPLHKIIQWFKTMTTNEYIKNVKQNNWKPFNKRFWQRNYYEHVVRGEKDLNEIREYITYNYLKWDEGAENLNNAVKIN